MKFKPRHHVLYRHFDGNGDLLYVGISGSFADRMSSHRDVTPWFADIKTITLEHFETRGQAAIAELEAIRTERPRFNTCHIGETAASNARRIKRIQDHEAFEAAERQEEIDFEAKCAAILSRCKP